MGYPMTYQRFINRNRLKDGDYGKLPESMAGLFSGDLTFDTLKRLQELERLLRALSGDLRRLEKDAVDEKGICEIVGQKAGVDVQLVAAVLKEFMAT